MIATLFRRILKRLVMILTVDREKDVWEEVGNVYFD